MNISQNPYQISKASDPVLGQGSLADKFKTIEDDENRSKDTSFIPFAFQHIIDTVGNLLITANNTRSIIPVLKTNININSDELKQVQYNIDTINTNIHSLTELLNNLSQKYNKNT